MNKSNEELEKIVEVISQIEQKTQIINDIVFQTKLLSFNASVEAQRAGENGKGFAVVAEEVGNLARISGQASSEIKELLQESTEQVNRIVGETSQKISHMAKESSHKIDSGNEIAGECQELLNGLMNAVVDVNQKVAQISVACVEQDDGITEIRSAMERLDSVTHNNSTVSNQANQSADVLKEEARRVADVASELNQLVYGEFKKAG